LQEVFVLAASLIMTVHNKHYSTETDCNIRA